MPVLYNPRNIQRAEMVSENEKGIRDSATLAGITSLVSCAILICVYRWSRASAEASDRFEYELHNGNHDTTCRGGVFVNSDGSKPSHIMV